MNFYYCNANPLLRWAEAQIPGASPSYQRIAQETIRIIEAADTCFAISEITIVEFHSNLFTFERDTNRPNFGATEADQCLAQLMSWVVHGQIQVINQPPKLVEKAMAYVALASRKGACALKAWDAIHLVQANYWAHSINASVRIVTNDTVFREFLRAFPEFTEFVGVYDPLNKAFYPQILTIS